MNSLDETQKESTATAPPAQHTIPWQNDLQLNLETWKQVAKHADMQRIVVSRKPLQLNVNYLQEYVEKAKASLKKRSLHNQLLHHLTSS
jgi:hypothetical protein